MSLEKESECEGQPPFLFKDKFGTYEIPNELIHLCDQFKKFGELIRKYLNILAFVASDQKKEYEGKNIHGCSYKKYAMNIFLDARYELVKKCGLEVVRQLDSFLKADSKGIEAGDERPLLGVDDEIIIALDHYVGQREGYKEIG